MDKLLSVSTYEQMICERQGELDSINKEISEVDKQFPALLEQEINLSVEQIKNGARAVIREERHTLINKLEDLELIKTNLEEEIAQLEEKKNIVLLIESLTPEVERYKTARDTYLSTFEKIQDKIHKYLKLGDEIKAEVSKFHLCQQAHPLNLLLGLSVKTDSVGVDFASIVNDGASGVSELGKFSLLQADIKFNELQEVVKALESFTQTVGLNQFYAAPFHREREEQPVLQSGRVSSGMQGTVDRTNFRRFDGPDPVRRGNNHDQQAAA